MLIEKLLKCSKVEDFHIFKYMFSEISASVDPLSVRYSEKVGQLKHQAYWHI